jgi:hypothetical protein
MPLGQSRPPPSVLRQGWAVTGNMACDMCMRPREVTPRCPKGEKHVLSIKDRRGAGCRAPPCCQCCLGGHRDPGCAYLQWQGSGCSPMWCCVGHLYMSLSLVKPCQPRRRTEQGSALAALVLVGGTSSQPKTHGRCWAQRPHYPCNDRNWAELQCCQA